MYRLQLALFGEVLIAINDAVRLPPRSAFEIKQCRLHDLPLYLFSFWMLCSI